MKSFLPKLAKTFGAIVTAASMTLNASAKSDFVLPRHLGDISPVRGSITGLDNRFSQVLNEFYGSPEVSGVGKMLVNDIHDYKNTLTKKVDDMPADASITNVMLAKNGRDALTTKMVMNSLKDPTLYALCAHKNFAVILDASGSDPLEAMRQRDLKILTKIMKEQRVNLQMVNGIAMYTATMDMEH